MVKKDKTEDGFELERLEVQAGARNKGFVEIKNASSFDNSAEILTNGAFNLIQE